MKFDLGTHVQEPDDEEPAGEGKPAQWVRPHGLTPVVEAWKGLVVILIIGFQPLLELMDELSTETKDRFFINPVTGVVALIIIASLIGIATSWISWLFTRYTVDDEAVQLRNGVLWRNRRQARLDRLQAVDVVQPILGRLIGLSELKVEVAGGQGSAVRIAYLKDTGAQQLRNYILARSAGLDVDEEEAAPEAPENQLFEVPFGRLIGSIVLSSAFIFPLVLVLVFTAASIADRSPQFLLANIPTMFVLGTQVWQRLNRGAFFRAATSPDGVRVTHGLLEKRHQTVPPGRIQAVRLVQPLLWRAKGWWRVEMNVAGYGAVNPNQALVNDLLPVGDIDSALRALWLVVPDFEIEASDDVLNSALIGNGEAHGFTTSPRRVRFIDPLVHKRTGFLATPPALLIRRGRLNRKLIVVPHARIQSVSSYQGPLQRALRVAKFQIDTTVGPIQPVLPHIDSQTAAELVTAQNEWARAARAVDHSERWMAEEGAK